MALLHKYWKTAAMAATGYTGDSPLFLVNYLIRLVRVAVLLTIWRMILSDAVPVDGLDLGAVLTYTLLAEVFGSLLTARTNLVDALWQGSIVGRMVQPLGLFGQFIADACGGLLFELAFFSLPLFLAGPLFGVNPLPASPATAGLFLASLTLALSVGFAVEFIFAALLVLWQLPLWAIVQIRNAVTTLLSGALIPLAFLPYGIGTLFSLLPFASMASAPLQIYIGAGDTARLLLLQILWSLALWPLAAWLWSVGRERMISYGG
jgi:ABC-2 type transport system permease protein